MDNGAKVRKTVLITAPGTLFEDVERAVPGAIARIRLFPLAAEGVGILNELLAYVHVIVHDNTRSDIIGQIITHLRTEAGATIDETTIIDSKKEATELKALFAERISDNAFVISDSPDALASAIGAGHYTIAVRTGRGEAAIAELHSKKIAPSLVVDSFFEAARALETILSRPY